MKKKWTAKTNRKWKRFFAVGCSHGHLADPHALETVLAFKKRWKPDCTIHLGDFLDLSPMMLNGRKAETDGSRLADDFVAGVTFLEQLEPQLIFAGNHEDRIPKLQEHSNSIISCGSSCSKNVTPATKSSATLEPSVSALRPFIIIGERSRKSPRWMVRSGRQRFLNASTVSSACGSARCPCEQPTAKKRFHFRLVFAVHFFFINIPPTVRTL